LILKHADFFETRQKVSAHAFFCLYVPGFARNQSERSGEARLDPPTADCLPTNQGTAGKQGLRLKYRASWSLVESKT